MNFNPRSPRGERRERSRQRDSGGGISIHAPREGSDRLVWEHWREFNGISIHAPREGSDVRYWTMVGWSGRFQSAPPARGATVRDKLGSGGGDYFNPRSPRGERRSDNGAGCTKDGISIHAPREGSDARERDLSQMGGLFQSTLPARGATGGRSGTSRFQVFQSTLPARGATLTT